jgi:DNA topoisomerase-2
MSSLRGNKKRYVKKDPVDHILDRPDMYVGSLRLRTTTEYIAVDKDDSYQISSKEIRMCPGLLRIFVEALSNAIDNVERSKKTKTPCTKIKVNINKETGETSVWNDGDIVPIEIIEEEKCYNHSMIFGQLLTSSNYDDESEEERLVSGRFGLGIKLTNVFSSTFTVKGCDPENGLILTQCWDGNMKNTDGPKVKKTKLKKGYTQVTWIPDFKRFSLSGYTHNIINYYQRFVLDAAMLTNVNVYLNDKLIKIPNLQSYAKLYNSPTEESVLIKNRRSTCLITPSSKEFESISFVNGVYTKSGGVHVDAWCEEIFRPLLKKFNKPKKPQINIRDIRQFFRIFVIATLNKPEWNGQDKNKLESPSFKVHVKNTYINAICKWSIVAKIEDIIRSKEMVKLKKNERKKKFTKIDGFDPANNSGGKKSTECSLIICEGLSAKTYAVAGIDKGVYGKTGRDWFGIYPLRGKLLNVRNAEISSIAANKVVTNIIQALGVRYDVDYTLENNYKTLRYGKIISMTDADCDGIHIEGLLLNLFHTLFPSLLKRKEPFFLSMKTPIVRISMPRRKDMLFYDERYYNNWIKKNPNNKYKIKYYKGLGTSRPEDVKDTFGLKMVEYINDDNTTLNIDKVFNNKLADSRKEWLGKYNPDTPTELDNKEQIIKMNISKFIDTYLIKFSHEDCKRSIPNCIDGLKESQRKILYAIKKKKLKHSGKSLKVAQLGGYVAEHTNYHHGEQNLFETIIKMANEFPGSNNIPLLYRDGQFGSRIEGGKDAASPRYIFTKMDALTHLIFREEDDILLDQVIDDNDVVQPYHYVPIIPMILANGCSAGIGTGWSCNIPSYNPLDLINCIKIWLDKDGDIFEFMEDETVKSALPDIQPWYRGFTGTIKIDGENRYKTEGNIESNGNTCVVTELPVNMWTEKFKEMCEKNVEDKNLKNMKNNSTVSKINFTLYPINGFKCDIKTLKLHSYLYTSNMVLFDDKEILHKHKSIDEIIDKFCIVRYKYYKKRKVQIIKNLEKELRFLGNKERFIIQVIENKLDILNNSISKIIIELETKKYDKVLDNDHEDGNKKNGYEYLLKIPIRSFTEENVKKIQNEVASAKKILDNAKKISEKKMWLNELDEFKKEYEKFIINIEKTCSNTRRKKK